MDDRVAVAVRAVEQHNEIDGLAAGQGRDFRSFDDRRHAVFFRESQVMPQRSCKAFAAPWRGGRDIVLASRMHGGISGPIVMTPSRRPEGRTPA